MNANDAIYLERWIVHRDPDAFREIVTRYAAMVFATGRRVLGNTADAEDVTQECFQALATAQKPPASYLGPWLHRVATNIALKKLRFASRLQAREEIFAATQPTRVEPTWDDLYAYVDEALAKLPDLLREPLVAHYIEGHSQTDIATAMGIPRQTLTNRIHKGIEEIRERLRKRGIPVAGVALGALLGANLAQAAPVPESVLTGLGKLALSGGLKNTAAAAGGIGAMLKCAIALVCVLGAAGAVYLVHTTSRPAPTAPSTTGPGSQPQLPAPSKFPRLLAIANKSQTPIEAEAPLAANAPFNIDNSAVGPAEITGIVLNPDGSPAHGATVVLTGPPENYWRKPEAPFVQKTRHTGPDGAFIFAHLPDPADFVTSDFVIHAFTADSAVVAVASMARGIATMELRLQASGELGGKVVDSVGVPVAGARVFPRPRELEGHTANQQAVARQVLSGQDGSFIIPHTPMGDYDLVITSSTHATLDSATVSTGQSGVRLVLEEGGSIVGKVTDVNTGAPIPGVNILVSYLFPDLDTAILLPWNVRFVRTDTDGTYRARNLRAANYRVGILDALEERYVYPENFTKPTEVAVMPNNEAAAPPLELAMGGVLAGRVVDPSTHKGVPGIPLTLLVRRTTVPLPDRAFMTTDEAGDFQYTGLPSGEHLLALHGYEQYSTRISSAPGEVVDNLKLFYDRASRIVGTVRYANGDPAPGATIKISSEENINYPRVFSDAGGHYVVPGLKSTATVYVQAITHHAESAWIEAQFAAHQTAEADLALNEARDASISGIIADASGRAIPDFGIIVLREDSPPLALGRLVSTDKAGHFQADRLTAGGYVMYQNGKGLNDTFARLDLGDGEHRQDLRLVIPGSVGLTISGRVIDATGKAIRDARVSLNANGGMAVTDTNGRFTLGGLESREYELSAGHHEYSRSRMESIPAGASDLEIVLQNRGRMSGRILDAGTGKPLSKFEVAFDTGHLAWYTEVPSTNWITMNDDSGAFLLDNVEAGDVTVLARADGYLKAIEHVVVNPDTTTEGVELRLERGGSAEGVVIDEAGGPVAGANIYLGVATSAEFQQSALTDIVRSAGDGSFSVSGISPRDQLISATHPDYAAGSAVVSPDGQKVKIVLTRSHTLTGTVQLDGAVVADASVSLLSDDTGARLPARLATGTNAEGRFEIRNIAAGAYKLSIQLPQNTAPGRGKKQFVEIRAVTEDVSIQFSHANAGVEGLVSFGANELSHATIRAEISQPDGTEIRSIQAGAEGAYRLENLPEGSGTLTAVLATPSGQSVTRRIPIELVAGELTHADIVVEGTGVVEGTVTGLDPGWNTFILVVPGALPEFSLLEELSELIQADSCNAQVDGDGKFHIGTLDPGSYTIAGIAVNAGQGEPMLAAQGRTTVTIEDGASTTVEIELH